jgi:hypothetical protein
MVLEAAEPASRPTRTDQRHRVFQQPRGRFLASFRQMALRAEGEDASCLVELRGFEPLTPCMPSRDAHHSAHHEPWCSRALHQGMRAVVWWFAWLRRAELLRICCAKWLVWRVHRSELLERRSSGWRVRGTGRRPGPGTVGRIIG